MGLAAGGKVSPVEAEKVQIEVTLDNYVLTSVQGPLPLFQDDDPAGQLLRDVQRAVVCLSHVLHTRNFVLPGKPTSSQIELSDI